MDLRRQARVEPWVIEVVLESGRFIGGPCVAAFESAFAEYNRVAYCVAVANGTDALELSLRAAGVQAGDEVATVANAGMYATTAIRAIGAIPVYVEVDPDRFLMMPSGLDEAVGPRTRAVVVTHLYGRMAPMREIVEIARRRGLAVVEDCAQAHGARLEERYAGSWGLAGAFSFYPTKNLGAYGDAGAIVTSDETFARRVRALREYGWEARFHSTVAGGRNSRMDEIQAAVLAAKLPMLNEANRRRRAIATRYVARLKNVEGLRVLADVDESFVAHLFVVACARRDELRAWLADRGVQTQVHYPVPDYLQKSQAGLCFRKGELPATEQCTREVLSLPCYPELRDDEVEKVAQALTSWRNSE